LVLDKAKQEQKLNSKPSQISVTNTTEIVKNKNKRSELAWQHIQFGDLVRVVMGRS